MKELLQGAPIGTSCQKMCFGTCRSVAESWSGKLPLSCCRRVQQSAELPAPSQRIMCNVRIHGQNVWLLLKAPTMLRPAACSLLLGYFIFALWYAARSAPAAALTTLSQFLPGQYCLTCYQLVQGCTLCTAVHHRTLQPP